MVATTTDRRSALRSGNYALDGGVRVKVHTGRSMTLEMGAIKAPIISASHKADGWHIKYTLGRETQSGVLTPIPGS